MLMALIVWMRLYQMREQSEQSPNNQHLSLQVSDVKGQFLYFIVLSILTINYKSI